MKALVRRPGPRLSEGIVTHVARVPVDAALALRQWEGYVDALHSAGWEPVEVAPADGSPDAVFVEDILVAYDGLAVVTRPGAEARRAERDGIEEAVAALGLAVERIAEPGTLDGGDVLRVGATVYAGRSARTNADGIRQLRALLGTRGATVVEAPVTRVLHLKSAVTALPDGAIVGWLPAVDEPSLFPGLVEAPEESGAHVLPLGGDRVLLAADCPRTAELVAARGYEPIAVDIGEFQKLEGCVTCLSVLLP